MIVSIIVWIIFGAVVGWIASLLVGTDQEQGPLLNIVVGIIGAVIGAFISSLLTGAQATGINIMSFIWAIIGACILLLLVRTVLKYSR